jgi:hypothetical protein
MFEPGGIYRFSYLWSWQSDRGEETGRKTRPVCLILRIPAPSERLFLFPISTKRPPDDHASIKIPEKEVRLAGLYGPSWLLLGEYNRTEASNLYDFESLEPLGSFSHAFFQEVLLAIKKTSAKKRLREIKRS